MNTLSREKQIDAIAALCEGVSVRATARLTGVDRGTIWRTPLPVLAADISAGAPP